MLLLNQAFLLAGSLASAGLVGGVLPIFLRRLRHINHHNVISKFVFFEYILAEKKILIRYFFFCFLNSVLLFFFLIRVFILAPLTHEIFCQIAEGEA